MKKINSIFEEIILAEYYVIYAHKNNKTSHSAFCSLDQEEMQRQASEIAQLDTSVVSPVQTVSHLCIREKSNMAIKQCYINITS